MAARRVMAQKSYQNGNWGRQTAALIYTGTAGAPWAVHAWDNWAHRTLGEAKAHYRRIGAL